MEASLQQIRERKVGMICVFDRIHHTISDDIVNVRLRIFIFILK